MRIPRDFEMTQGVIFFVRLLCYTTVLLLTCAPVKATDNIRITTGEWEPYISKILPGNGIVPSIITQAFERENITVTYGFFPWGRSMALARSGSWDASAVWFYHPEREKDFLHSDFVLATEEVFFHLTSREFDWTDWTDLKEMNIGVTASYTVTKILQEKAGRFHFTIDVSPSDEINFRKLLVGHIDLFPLAKEVAAALLKKKFTKEQRQQITFHPKIANSGKMYLLLSKKAPRNRQLLEHFNSGMRKLKASGDYDILVQDWKKDPSNAQ